MSWKESILIRERLARERGTPTPAGDFEVALVYPGPYAHGMASLGFLWIQRVINSVPGWAAYRAFMPERDPDTEPTTYEGLRPISELPIIAFSVGYERDLINVARILSSARIPPCRRDRVPGRDPLIIGGGPITYAQPRLLGEMCDIVFVGEAEKALTRFLRLVGEGAGPLEAARSAGPGVWIPSESEEWDRDIPLQRQELPAYAPLTSPESEFGERMLMEVVRGCSRPCSFCVMSRVARGVGMRVVDVETLLDVAQRSPVPSVGLVGAGIGDHPHLKELLRRLVEMGYTFSLSSLRPTHFDEEMAQILKKGGVRTITVAADGLSERLRSRVGKQVDTEALIRAARLAGKNSMKVKLYQIIGYPDEGDEDVREFVELGRQLASLARVSITISPLVPKPGTPLADAPAPERALVRSRIREIRKGLRNVQIQPVSWREARLEYLMDAHPHEAARAVCSDPSITDKELLRELERLES